jgi:transcriptional regulator of acetoin/glycerol metabolism
MTFTEQLVIVRRNQFATFAMLAHAFAQEPKVRLVWDRRTGDRRQTGAASAGSDRRRADRRGDPASTWRGNDYLLLTVRDGKPAGSPSEAAEGAGAEHQQLVRDLGTDLDAAAGSDLSVLLSGGDAASRKFLAQWIHRRSDRSSQPLVVVDGAVFAELAAAAHGQYGAGASSLTGGTLFIEEIGEWTMRQQSDLVRFVERIAPLGTSDGQPPARLISATDHWLHDRVAAREFRLDLFYRLNAIHLVLPSERRAVS